MKVALATVRSLILGVAVIVGLSSELTCADQPSSIPRIGILTPPIANSPMEEGLQEGLRDLGYVEGKNILIEWKRFGGSDAELPLLATDLARSKLDLIVVNSTPAARVALKVGNMPVVFAPVGDPVANGLAVSIAKPGGNGTGVSVLTTELTAKRLELLREFAPRARRIVYLMNSSNPSGMKQFEATQKAARTLGVQLIPADTRNATELDTALRGLPRGATNAMLVSADILYMTKKTDLAQAIRRARLVAMVASKAYLEDGPLVSYGPDLKEVGRSAAVYVDKILKGVKPADLPIEQISKFELVIDLRVAHEQNFRVPQELLLRADEVIK